jgi:hypothetical protein
MSTVESQVQAVSRSALREKITDRAIAYALGRRDHATMFGTPHVPPGQFATLAARDLLVTYQALTHLYQRMLPAHTGRDINQQGDHH